MALSKLHPDLLELVQADGLTLPAEAGVMATGQQEAILVEVLAESDLDLGAYFVDGEVYAGPAFSGKGIAVGLRAYYGMIVPTNVLKVAFLPDVQAINSVTPVRAELEPYPADDPRPEYVSGPADWAEMRLNADKLRAGSLPWEQAQAFGDGRNPIQPMDWFEMSYDGPVNAQAAWDRGYHGEGVAVAVIDDGVDFAHPDLMGTQRVYSSTEESQYNGWPMAMDPFTLRAWFFENLGLASYIADGFPGVTFMDTSETPDLTPCGTGLSCFDFTPLIDYGAYGVQHTYVISSDMSLSGVVHAGTHHDESLRDYIWGEKVAILVTDPNTAGVYDTVYVDLDDDYDFRDEKPLTRADTTDETTLAATYNDMIAYRDMNGDGLADLSGGMLYFIADGVNHPPAFDWLFAAGLYGFTPPGNGDLVAIHGPWDSGYSHGTNCASNVVAQGVVDGMLPEFRDLGGPPDAAVKGAAPKADMVAMNNGWYFTGYSNANDAYFLAAIGWDAIDQYGDHWWYGSGYTDTDTIVATSNSYGWSADFNDGWGYHGQSIEVVQNYFAPHLQFLFSTGNGGPGYGTVAPPSPGHGIAVGASTEYGSTGSRRAGRQPLLGNLGRHQPLGPGGPGRPGARLPGLLRRTRRLAYP
jgi:hypothetical protein